MKACDRAPKRSGYIVSLIILAILIKLSLFVFVSIHAPQGKMLPDSETYLKTASVLASKAAFATQDKSGALSYEILRTPGYPLFLAFFKEILKIPLDGIVFLQIIMTILTAFIVYRTALEIDRGIALLSVVIILFDPPITIFSLTILTETLFLLLISLFMLSFTLYLKHRRIKYIIFSALLAAAATYVRPVSYYLGLALILFILCMSKKGELKKYIIHAMVFGVVVYSLLGAWQARNYFKYNDTAFSSAGRHNLSTQGLFKSYARNKDSYTKNMAPFPYYVNVSFRCLMSLMTRPGNFKYFQSEGLKVGSFIFSYPWMVFWLSGFLMGAFRIKRNIYLWFMLLVAVYFIITSIGALMWGVGERLRVPMMPFIAIISAYGWRVIHEMF